MTTGSIPSAAAAPAFKFCGKCKLSKPLTAFARHSRRKDGLQSACRSCFATHYTPKRTRSLRTPTEAPMAQVLAVIARMARQATPEAVAQRQLLVESATCARGHAQVLGNVYVRPSGRSECRPCAARRAQPTDGSPAVPTKKRINP